MSIHEQEVKGSAEMYALRYRHSLIENVDQRMIQKESETMLNWLSDQFKWFTWRDQLLAKDVFFRIVNC